MFYYKNSCIINMRELSALLTILIIVNILQDPAETHHIHTLFPHTFIHGIYLDKLPCLYVFSLTKHKWDTAPTRIVQKPICTIIRICSGLINRKPREMLCTWERWLVRLMFLLLPTRAISVTCEQRKTIISCLGKKAVSSYS